MNQPTTTTVSAITEKVKLGQEITFDATYHRRSIGDKRSWEQREHKERKGIVVGARTIWDGEVEVEHIDAIDGGGVSTSFVPRDHKPALLVAFALNRKPVLVPIANAIAA